MRAVSGSALVGLLRGICCAAFLMLAASPAVSQLPPGALQATSAETVEAPAWDSLSPQERRDLLSRLSDEQVRAVLAAQLDRTAAEASTAETSMIGGFEERARRFRENLGKLLTELTGAQEMTLFTKRKARLLIAGKDLVDHHHLPHYIGMFS